MDETGAGGDVEFEVGVMHAVQAPERRHGMEHHVLKVDREVEKHHARWNRNPRGNGRER